MADKKGVSRQNRGVHICKCKHTEAMHRRNGNCRKCECKKFEKTKMTDEGHPIGCLCTSCRVARIEETINEMSFRISLLSSWAEQQWKAGDMSINPITGSITSIKLSEDCKKFQEEYTKNANNTVMLYSEASIYGGIQYLLFMDDKAEMMVRRIGIGAEYTTYIHEVITPEECFKLLKDIPKADIVEKNFEKSKQTLIDHLQKKTEAET